MLEPETQPLLPVHLWFQGRQGSRRASVTLILKLTANDHSLKGKITVGTVGGDRLEKGQQTNPVVPLSTGVWALVFLRTGGEGRMVCLLPGVQPRTV